MRCEAPSRGRTPRAQPLPFIPEAQGTRRGGRHWLGRCAPGRGLEGRDGQSRPGPARTPQAGPTPVRLVRVNHAAEGRGRPRAGPIRGVKSVLLLTRQKGPTEI